MSCPKGCAVARAFWRNLRVKELLTWPPPLASLIAFCVKQSRHHSGSKRRQFTVAQQTEIKEHCSSPNTTKVSPSNDEKSAYLQRSNGQRRILSHYSVHHRAVRFPHRVHVVVLPAHDDDGSDRPPARVPGSPWSVKVDSYWASTAT